MDFTKRPMKGYVSGRQWNEKQSKVIREEKIIQSYKQSKIKQHEKFNQLV